MNGFRYEGRCGEMFHKNQRSIYWKYSGSFDVLSKIRLLTFLINWKVENPFPLPTMSWCDPTPKCRWMGYVSSQEDDNRWILGLCWCKIRQCTPPIVEVTLIRPKWRYWHMYVPSLKPLYIPPLKPTWKQTEMWTRFWREGVIHIHLQTQFLLENMTIPKPTKNILKPIPSLKLTTKAPENRPNLPQKEAGSYSNHPFSGANLLLVSSHKSQVIPINH